MTYTLFGKAYTKLIMKFNKFYIQDYYVKEKQSIQTSEKLPLQPMRNFEKKPMKAAVLAQVFIIYSVRMGEKVSLWKF